MTDAAAVVVAATHPSWPWTLARCGATTRRAACLATRQGVGVDGLVALEVALEPASGRACGVGRAAAPPGPPPASPPAGARSWAGAPRPGGRLAAG